jgi:ABC-type multidrug transport system fused ATPase/permease subunit
MPTGEDELISSILLLQDVEKRLFGNLEAAVASKVPRAQQEAIMDEMNEVAASRASLYDNLLTLYSDKQSVIANTRQDLVDQKTVVRIFEDQMNKAKHNFNAMKAESANKLRMVEINTYYGKKYQAFGGILKVIAIACLPLILLAILKNQNILPSTLITFLSIVIIIVTVYLVVRRVIDILSRSNMSFDEYNWHFDPSTQKSLSRGSGSFDLRSAADKWARGLAGKFGVGCVGQECCSDGMSYDATKNKCVEAASSHTQSSSPATVAIPVSTGAPHTPPISLHVEEAVEQTV